MWGSQGWNQWALQPAMFNDVPHEQIDWAELAKQWIQMQQTQPSEAASLAPPPLPQVVPPVSLPPPPPPPGHVPLMTEEFPENNIVPPLLKAPVPSALTEPFHTESPFENEPVPFVPKTTDNNSFWNKPQWEASVPNDVNERLWPPPPVEQTAPILPGKETFDYGHVHDNPPLAMQSIDYNHMSDFSYNQMYPTPAPAPEAPYDQYWSQVNSTPTISPIFLKKERNATNLPVEEESTQIDAAKRKQLPAWIRDGLEKMEQERLKRLEKERAAKENAEKMAKMDLLKNNLDFKEGSSTTTVSMKSKFDSDSEADENEPDENKRISPVLKRTPSPAEDMRTEEERKEELMLKVRRTLTEVLLSVTNSEMMDIAQEMFRKAVSKAPARQLATAASLTSVASGLRGLASYGTESEASEQEEGNGSDSEEELYRKIKEKKKLFAQKEKKIIADLERKEYEGKFEAEREKLDNDKNNEKKSSKDFHAAEKSEEPSDSVNDRIDSSNAYMQPVEHISPVEPPVSSTEIEDNYKSSQTKLEILKPLAENAQSVKKELDSSDSEESSSSSTTCESGEKHKKKVHKETKKSKSESKKSRKDKSSSKHISRRRRSRSRDSESSEKHRRERSRDRRNSSSKKKKKYKRSDSSDSSSSSSHRRKRSSRYESGHRDRRSRSYDDRERRRKHSVSPSRSHYKSDGRSSRSHRYSDDKYDRKYKDDRKYYDHRHKSPSPSGHSSRLPRKYRSRSLSSESQSSGKKLKKYRNR